MSVGLEESNSVASPAAALGPSAEWKPSWTQANCGPAEAVPFRLFDCPQDEVLGGRARCLAILVAS
jgi:hypothetical protein